MAIEVQSRSELQHTIAIVDGQALTSLPSDLYIPPDALRVFLATFQGPFDLLLYLIKKQNLNILDIPIAEVTRQYVEYIELMQELNLELAAEYLVMAAFLAEIKSKMLLPRPANIEIEAEDPRSELIRKLQEYEQFKTVAEILDTLPRVERDFFLVCPEVAELNAAKPQPKIDLEDLFFAMAEVLHQTRLNSHHQIQLEPLSIHERMSEILNRVHPKKFIQFSQLFSTHEGRFGVVVTFIAILELIKQSLIEIIQAQPYAPIHIRAVTI